MLHESGVLCHGDEAGLMFAAIGLRSGGEGCPRHRGRAEHGFRGLVQLRDLLQGQLTIDTQAELFFLIPIRTGLGGFIFSPHHVLTPCPSPYGSFEMI